MGSIITFPGLRRALRDSPLATRRGASVIILPVIRIARDSDTPAAVAAPRSKSRSCRKRRGPATRT
jgi:hypothetical protein